MIAKTDFVGIAILIAACAAAFSSVVAAWYGRGTKRELKTFNDQSVGQQVSATTSARYVQIPVGDRTDAQVQHLLDVPPEGRAMPAQELKGNPEPAVPLPPPPPPP